MKILIVSPHPDDETLGAGGTILRMIAEGNDVFWLNVTTMINSEKFPKELIEKRKTQLEKIEEFYGFKKVYHLNMPTTKLDNMDSAKAIDMVALVMEEVKPEILILPYYNDVHSDHKKVFEWCYACSKVFRYPYVKKILTMEIVSETEFSGLDTFSPNYFIDITKYIEGKMQALRIYDTEISAPPFPRSEENVRALATVRGAMAGVRYAEAFHLIKCIE